jgi:hypothetical protein
LKLPRRNLVPIAIQKFELKPKRALKIAIEIVPKSIMGFLP